MNFSLIGDQVHRKKHFMEDKVLIEKKLSDANKRLLVAVETQAYIQEKAREIQIQLKVFLDKINQTAIDLAFPGYIFSVDFSIKNDATSADIFIENNGRKQKPLDDNGGGLANIIAMCSQMAAKKMGSTRNTIIADQPMKDLSKGGKEDMAMEMLRQVTEDTGIQYIMISHLTSQINAADKVIEIVKVEKKGCKWGVSTVKSDGSL